MTAEPKLFDKIEAEEQAAAEAEEQRQLLAGFKFLQHDFVLEVTGKFQPAFRPLVYSSEFTNFTKALEGIRDRLQSEEIDIHTAFKEAVDAGNNNGFEAGLSLGADGKIDASVHMKALKEEMDKLKFYPSYPSHSDGGDREHARSELNYRERRELEKARAYLTLKPLFAYAVDEDHLKSEVRQAIAQSLGGYNGIGEDDLNTVVGWRGLVDLSPIADQVIELIRPPLEKRGVMIRLEADKHEPA